jgi:hypothetical protein
LGVVSRNQAVDVATHAGLITVQPTRLTVSVGAS